MIGTSLLLRIGGIALVVLVIALGGARCQKGRDADALAAANQRTANAATALGQAHVSLKAAASALRAQNAANREAVAEEKRRAKLAEDARVLADRALADANAKASQYARDLEEAGRRRPGCQQLLDVDVRQTCGL